MIKLKQTAPVTIKYKPIISNFSKIIFLLCITFSQNTSASIEHWIFSDVKFSDGGILTGSFDFDTTKVVSQDAIFNWSIEVQGGNVSVFPQFNWDSSNSKAIYQSGSIYFGSNQMFPPIPPNYYNNASRNIQMYTTPPLEFVTSGSVPLNWLADCYNCSPARLSMQGSLIETASSVPLPAAVWLFASGLGLLSFTRRKNQNS